METGQMFLRSVGICENQLYGITANSRAVVEYDFSADIFRYKAGIGDGLPKDFMYSTAFIEGMQGIYLLDKHGTLLLIDFDERANISWKTGIEIDTEDDICYSRVIKKGDWFLIFPKYGKTLVRFNVRTMQTESNDLFPEFSYKYDPSACIPMFCGAFNTDESVVLPTGDGTKILIYGINDGMIERKNISSERTEMVHSAYFDGQLFLLDIYGNVYRWKNDKDLKLFSKTFENKWYGLGIIAVTQNSLWLMPALGDNIEKVDLHTSERETYSELPKDLKYTLQNNMQSKYLNYSEDEKYYYFANPASEYMIWINKKNDETYFKKVIIPDNNKLLNSTMNIEGYVREGSYTASDYISFVKNE